MRAHLSQQAPYPLQLEIFHVKHASSQRPPAAFKKQLESWGVTLEQEDVCRLALYVEELAGYDKANVVGTRDGVRLWMDHVLDSLSCLLYEPLKAVDSLVDVGSGAGMPGIPLHVAVDFRRVCLLESTGKKAEFMKNVLGRVGGTGAEVANLRAEEAGRAGDYRENFEAVTARAVAPLNVISEYCLPLLAPGGVMIAMKGRVSSDERELGSEAVEELGGEIEKIIKVPLLPELEPKERHLVVIKKACYTPSPYPRKPGTPKKHPLGTTA